MASIPVAIAEKREYRSWQHIRQDERRSPNAPRVCARWKASFEAFLADMGPCPEGHRLWRRDKGLPFEPGNCVWAKPRRAARVEKAVLPADPCGRCDGEGGSGMDGAKAFRYLDRRFGMVCLQCRRELREIRAAAGTGDDGDDGGGKPADGPTVLKIRREWEGLVGPRERPRLDDLSGAEWSRVLVAMFDRRRPSDLREIVGRKVWLGAITC